MSHGNAITLRTAAWYGDHALTLDFPANWQLTVHWPQTPDALTDREIADSLEHPIGQPPVRELCRGKLRPVVIVDDLNRPTPAARIIPHLLRQFEQGGIAPEKLTFVIAPGTHAAPPSDGPAKKVGVEAAERCRVVVHDCRGPVVRLGKTSFGTPVLVNPEVAAADFIVGIGGVYPNFTAGFGGGSKLALGVLGWNSIFHLHYRHPGMGGRYDSHNSFRRDLDEIAALVRLQTNISLHVDANRDIVRVTCGDHRKYYADAVAFSHSIYSAASPHGADVVVTNTYPGDLSLLFSRMKGFAPLRHCGPQVSRVAIASCPEGVGFHGIYPELTPPRFRRERELLRRLSVMPVGEMANKTFAKIGRKLSLRSRSNGNGRGNGNGHRYVAPSKPASQRDVWLYRPLEPGKGAVNPLPKMPGVHQTSDWANVIDAIGREQGDGRQIQVVVYPCASLQCVEDAPTEVQLKAEVAHLGQEIHHE